MTVGEGGGWPMWGAEPDSGDPNLSSKNVSINKPSCTRVDHIMISYMLEFQGNLRTSFFVIAHQVIFTA